MKEIWKDIKGFEGYYKLSNLGRVKSIRKILKQDINNWGYNYVKLSVNGVMEKMYIHRIVASHFLGEIPKQMQINHKDGNKQNNTISNLEIVTRSENMQHAYDNGLIIPKRKYDDETIRKIKEEYKNHKQIKDMIPIFKDIPYSTLVTLVRR